MFITKKHISRRLFLKGAGIAVGLPLLDAMFPACTAYAQTPAAPLSRFGFIYFPHGAIMDKWTPTTTGRTFELPPILKPLELYKKQLTIVSGLEGKAAIGPVHALAPGTWLNDKTPPKLSDPHGGTTIDQIIAKHIGQETPLPSLEIAIEAGGGIGQCDREYGCSYTSTLAFSSPTTPLPMETDPRKLFDRLFGQGETPEERAIVAKQNKSILDLIKREAADLKRTLGVRDQAMLSDYLDTVREIERRVQKMEAHDVSHLPLPQIPEGRLPYETHVNLMLDMVVLAFQANLTRVFSFMMAAEVSLLTFNNIGVPDSFHPLSHHSNDQTKIDKLVKVQIYLTQIISKFIAKLAAAPDGDGSLLDHSGIMYGSNMSNSDKHDHFPLPTTIIGNANGKIKGGQHLKYPDRTPLSNLLLTIAQRSGAKVDKVGDGGTTPFGEV